MRIGRRLEQETENIPLAPLIDIVFLTLVFFMTTAVFASLEAEIDIVLPTASSAVPSDRTRGEIFINVKKDGRIILNDREMDLDELQQVLNRVSEHFPGGAVIIRGDREAALGTAVAVMDCCKNADIQNISIAAVTEDPDEPS